MMSLGRVMGMPGARSRRTCAALGPTTEIEAAVSSRKGSRVPELAGKPIPTKDWFAATSRMSWVARLKPSGVGVRMWEAPEGSVGGRHVEPVEARDPVKPWWRNWAPERMLGDEGREIASSGNEALGAVECEGRSWASERMLGYGGREVSASGNDAAGVPVVGERGKLAVWDVKARTACWPAT